MCEESVSLTVFLIQDGKVGSTGFKTVKRNGNSVEKRLCFSTDWKSCDPNQLVIVNSERFGSLKWMFITGQIHRYFSLC